MAERTVPSLAEKKAAWTVALWVCCSAAMTAAQKVLRMADKMVGPKVQHSAALKADPSVDCLVVAWAEMSDS